MRVSSLSDERVIRRVSSYLVPAWLSRDHYQLAAPPREETELVAKIDADRHRKKLEGGAVCVYIVRADGTALTTLPVQKASKPDLLVPFLDEVIRTNKLTPRDSEAVKASAAPPAERARPSTKDGLLFTCRSRFDDRGVNRGTSRDTIELSREEWGAFTGREAKAWEIPTAVAEKLLRYAYPPLPHWSAKQGKFTAVRLRAERGTEGGGEVSIRLRGELRMTYPHQGKPTDGEVSARLVGFARVDAKSRRLTALMLTSEEGRYTWRWEGKPQVKPMSFAVEQEADNLVRER